MTFEVNQDALEQYKRMQNMNNDSYAQNDYLSSPVPESPSKRTANVDKKSWGKSDSGRHDDWVGGFSPAGKQRRSWKIKEKK